MKNAQIEQIKDSYFSAMAMAKAYYKRASQPLHAHNYAHSISKAVEYENKAKALGRLINRLGCEQA